MENALHEAGFIGVETVGDVIYARTSPALPEFTVALSAGKWQLAQSWPLRATPAQIAVWNAENPNAVMDIHQGETRITAILSPETLGRWADLTLKMVAQCTAWRRETRQRDEGM
jgi:hypothetical protein